MRSMYLFLTITFLSYIGFNCSDNDPIGTTVTKVVTTKTAHDTVTIDTTHSLSLVAFDTTVSDTTISTSVDSLLLFNHKYCVKTSIYDTLKKHHAKVDSMVFLKRINTIRITDTLNTIDKSLISDTLDTIFVDSLYEVFLEIQFIDSTDTVVSLTTLYDSLPFPNQYLIGSNTNPPTAPISHGSMFSFLTDSTFTGFPNTLLIDPDHSLFTYHSSLYTIERTNSGTITRYNGPNISPKTKVYSLNLGAGVKPQDISFVSGSQAYVTQYLDSLLIQFDPVHGSITKKINLAPYAINAGTPQAQLPYMHESIIIGSNLYILLKRLRLDQGNHPVPDSTIGGLLLVLSTHNNSIIDTIPLTLKNPVSMDYFGGILYVASSGLESDSTDGGIEKVTIDDRKNLGIITTELEYSGNFSDITIISKTKAYVSVTRQNTTVLIEFNPQTGQKGTWVSSIENIAGTLSYDGLFLYVSDAGATNSGIVLLNPETNQFVRKPISFGPNPPQSIALMTLLK